jgi:hypothetical protein
MSSTYGFNVLISTSIKLFGLRLVGKNSRYAGAWSHISLRLYHKTVQSRLPQAVMLLTHIPELFCWNIGQSTDYIK